MSGIVVSYGDAIFKSDLPATPIIQGVLWEHDVVMLLGNEKAGKSILALQMAFNITTGRPFLGKYEVPNPSPVVYLQTEGKHDEMVARINAMSTGVPVTQDHFCHVYRKRLHLDIPTERALLVKALQEYPERPRVVIVDSLYSTMAGDMEKNHDTQRFQDAVELFLAETGVTTVVFIHHEKKEFRDLMGREVDRDDTGSFGSVYWRAWVEHILYLKANKRTKVRTLSCNTQRSGRVFDRETLVMVQPQPLHFQIKGPEEGESEAEAVVLAALAGGEPMTKEMLTKKTRRTIHTVERAVLSCVSRGVVRRMDSNPATYVISR